MLLVHNKALKKSLLSPLHKNKKKLIIAIASLHLAILTLLLREIPFSLRIAI